MNKAKSSSTIRDVARLAGVSVATISRHLNNTAPLSPETAERVQAAMRELDFSPHPAARSLATKRTNTISLVLDKIEGDYFTPLLEGVLATTEVQNYNLLIFSSNQSRHLDAHILGPTYTDGLLVFLDALNDEEGDVFTECDEEPMFELFEHSDETMFTFESSTYTDFRKE